MTSINDKISRLRDYYIRDRMEDYLESEGKNAITEEEAYKLYTLPNSLGIGKDVLYFLMSNENKRKHIDDLENINIPFQGWENMVDDKELLYQIIEKYINNEKNIMASYKIYNLLDLCKDNDELKFKVLHKQYIKTGYFGITAAKELPVPYQYALYKELIKNMSEEGDIGRAIRTINNISNPEVYNDLVARIIKSYAFKNVASRNSRTQMLINSMPKERVGPFAKYALEHYNELCTGIAFEIITPEHAEPSQLIDYIKKDYESIDYQLLCDYLSKENWNALYNLFLQNEEDKENYCTRDFVIRSTCLYPKEIYREILKNELYLSDKFTTLEKCETVYLQFYGNDEKLLEEIDFMMEYIGEEITPYFEEMVGYIWDKYDMSSYNNIKKMLVKQNNITNLNNFEKFVNRFGTLCLHTICNENIVNLINSDEKDYDTILNLIDSKNSELNMDVINTMTNSLLNRQYRIDRPDEYNIFSKFERLLQEKTPDNLSSVAILLNEMLSTGLDLSSFEKEKELEIDNLFKGDPVSINILHNLTDAYIARQRELYFAKRLAGVYDNELKIEKYYNRNYIKKQFFIYKDYLEIYNDLQGIIKKVELTDEEKEFCDSAKLLEIMEFKNNPMGQPPITMQKELKMLDIIMDKLYEGRALFLNPEPKDAKYEYLLPKKDDDNILTILSGIDTLHVKKCLKNQEIYKNLNELFNKYRIPGWGEVFARLGKNADLEIDNSTVYTLINYFDKIYEHYKLLPPKSKTITALLDIAGAYASTSEKYKYLIDKDNLEYIITNPQPNASSINKETRVSFIPSCVKMMYERDGITIPNGEVTLSVGEEGNQLNVSIGDIYDPIALTYGERTGACLRIKGAFHDLFEFCLKDKNGFHIRFTNPNTGEFVSRVSGIRNGNTVFLNELRNSVSYEYSNEDLVDALNQIAKFLVEQTKDDPHPIENVIVSNDYAMEQQASYELNLENTKDAFRGLSFNIKNTGNILYTSNENHKELMPYKFGDEHSSVYKAYNTKVNVAKGEIAQEKIKKQLLLKEMMDGKNIGEVDLPEEIDVVKCVYGHGWAVYQNSKGKIEYLILDKFKKDKRLLEMIENATRAYLGGAKNENNRKNS